jgi:4-hydroxy-tetrahydrodipicolinate reductase
VLRVGVLGAAGRMGQQVCRAVEEDPDLELVAAVDPAPDGATVGDTPISEGTKSLLSAEPDVVVDFTRPDAVMDNVRFALEHGIHVVVGTTGVGPADLEEIERRQREHGKANVIVAPNFAIGAVLMQRFAQQAARFFPAVEIIELHHEGKVDAPSGTALDTAMRLTRERTEAWAGPGGESMPGVRGGELDGVRVHSVRLPGLVAHQEVIFGGPGQTLTIRHDSLDRTSFMPGVLMAVKAVASRPGLTVGLESLLELP